MTVPQKRRLAKIFMTLGGVSWIVFGLSHLLFPALLKWTETLKDVPPVDVFGFSISNRGYIYLFNADLLLYDILLGVVSLLLAPAAGKGKRLAVYYSIGMGVYFIPRACLQLFYFGASLLDLGTAVASLIYAALYLFPLTCLKDFAEE